jgi:hypothetical protein
MRLSAAIASLPVITWCFLTHADNISVAEAEKRFEEGKQLFAQGRYEEAHVKFSEACAAHPTTKCPKNLGLAEYRLKHAPESATHLREYLAKADPNDADVATIRTVYDDVKGQCGELDVSAPGGAKVSVDGKIAGTAPLDATLFVGPGKHDVSAAWEGKSDSKPVDVAARAKERIVLGPPTTQPPPGTTEKSVMWPPPTPAILLAATGAAALIGGAIFNVVAAGKTPDVQNGGAMSGGTCNTMPQVPACSNAQSALQSQSTLSAVSLTMYIGGGVLLTTGVVWWLITPRKQTVTARVVPTMGGATLEGTF